MQNQDLGFKVDIVQSKNFYEQQSQNFVAFFLSDLHLRNNALEDIKTLESFITYLKKNNSKAEIYFLGDIFDFWFGPASPVKTEVKSLIHCLQDYNQNCGKIIFFEGNHDVHLTDHFSKYGIEVVKDDKIILIKNKKVILEHGDLFNPEDKKYLFLRRFLRKPWMRILATYIVPAFITSNIGFYFSNLSSKTTKVRSKEKSNKIKNTFIQYANKRLNHLSGDVFIAGHTHERMNLVTDEKTKRTQIINLGSWYDSKTVLGLSLSSDQNGLNLEFYKL